MPVVIPPTRTKGPDKSQWRVIWGTVVLVALVGISTRDPNNLVLIVICSVVWLSFLQTRKWHKALNDHGCTRYDELPADAARPNAWFHIFSR